MPKSATDRVVRFYLEKPNAKAPTYVRLIFTYRKKRFDYFTRCAVTPKNWNGESFRVKDGVPNAEAVNHRLNEIRTHFKRLLRDYEKESVSLNDAPDFEAIRASLDQSIKNVAPSPSSERADTDDVLAFIESFIADEQNTKRHNTLKQYGTAYNHLKRYIEHSRIRTLRFDAITLEFYKAFRTFLHEQVGLFDNSVGTTIKNLKTFLNEAHRRGLNRRTDYKSFPTPTEDADTVYLSPAEIDRIWALDLREKPGLELVRDGFVAQCYLGMRYSDLVSISRDHLDEARGIIKVRTQKTDEMVAVPLHPYVAAVIEKYRTPVKHRNRKQDDPNTLIPVYTNQKFNDGIKVVARMAGLLERVQVTRTKWNVQTTKTVHHKYELVSSHSARRSFATNLFLQGFPTLSIMKITGHTTERSFLKYIRVSAEENAMKLDAFWKANTASDAEKALGANVQKATA